MKSVTHRLCILVVAPIVLGAATLAPANDGARPIEVSLLAGGRLDAWMFYTTTPGARLQDTWSIRDGVLRCNGGTRGYLRTRAKYTNYLLQLEWRWPADSNPGDSGVLMRIGGPDKLWPRCVEAQMHTQNAGDLYGIDGFPLQAAAGRAGSSHLRKLNPSSEKPPGEWNQFAIVLNRDKLLVKVNGVLQNEAVAVDAVSGHIGLQSEGAAIEFRNIRLMPLGR